MTAENLAIQNYACGHCRAVFRTAFVRCPLDGEPLAPLIGDPLSGTSFADRYIIETCVGEGGMGRVYRARHQHMSRRFAIKVLFGDHAADTKMRQRLAREAEAASRLSHPNVISVLDFGETAERLLYLVMDYVDGPTLSQVIERDAPLPSERVIKIVRDCARGLAHAHARGLIHRDFKADNVLLSYDSGEETAKIVDFGIAILNDPGRSRKLTTEGMVLGTPAVMAPEQAVGEDIDHRTDLFSLGVVTYEMLAGVLPFDGTPLQIARQNMASVPPRFAERVPGLWVDPELEKLVFALMAKKPEERPQSAKEVLRALGRIQGENSLEFRRAEAAAGERTNRLPRDLVSSTPAPAPAAAAAAPPQPASYTEATGQRSRRFAWVLALLLLVAAGGAGILMLRRSAAGVSAAAADAGIALADATREVAAPPSIDAAPAAAVPADAAVATAPPDAAPVPAPDKAARDKAARIKAERERRRRERERLRARKQREAERRRQQEAARDITPAAFLARFKAVGRKLNQLSAVDAQKARALNRIYSRVKANLTRSLRDQETRARYYKLLGTINARAARALKN